MNKLLKNRIISLCARRGISQRKVEQDLKIADKSIAHLDTNMPRIDKLAAFADYFGVTTDYLIGRKEGLPETDATLLRKFHALTDEQQGAVLGLVDVFMVQTEKKKIG